MSKAPQPAQPARNHRTSAQRLAQAGYDPTPRRLAVLDALTTLAQQPHAFTAPELLALVRQNVAMDKVTLYRVLDLLTGCGVVQRHSGGDGVFRYCLTREGEAMPHGHFYCTRCGRTTCLGPLPDALAQALVAAESGASPAPGTSPVPGASPVPGTSPMALPPKDMYPNLLPDIAQPTAVHPTPPLAPVHTRPKHQSTPHHAHVQHVELRLDGICSTCAR